MCGICGKISVSVPPDGDLVSRMCSRLVHRGPDAGGVFMDKVAALGHRRLSVIDTSESANQPMKDATGNLVIVFNGEIYNFSSLREELEESGARFRTVSDTEVVLEAYSRWGADCVNKFNGMFAFAIWNTMEKRLFMARDRLGKKPLFYKLLPGGIVFASELKALVEDPAVGRAVNHRAVGHYLSLNYILSSECIIDGVKKLPPAHYMEMMAGGAPDVKRYWDIASFFRNKTELSEVVAAEKLDALLRDAVCARLISDVPLGAFLSGGIDSSAIVAAMRAEKGGNATETFTIDFPEKTYSEAREAAFAAETLGVNHREKTVAAEMARHLEKIVYHADEPFADTSMIPVYYLSAFAREHVTVCLSGDGGDEIFAGYETYAADRIYDIYRRTPAPLAAAVSAAADRLLPVTFGKVSSDYKLRQFLKAHGMSPAMAHYSWREIFSPAEKQRLVNPDVFSVMRENEASSEFLAYDAELAGCAPLDRAMYVDIKTWLADDILVKADRMSMAHSLEVRSPMLDHRVVEFAASLPPGMKMKGFRKKHILKESQSRNLPAKILDRQKKGFNAPVSYWFRNSMGRYVDEMLDGTNENFGAMFSGDEIRLLWREHNNGSRDNGLKLFGLVNLHLWMKSFGV